MDLAKNMKVSDDSLRYTFELRDDVVWTDGEPLSAQDVKFSYELNMKIVFSQYVTKMSFITELKTLSMVMLTMFQHCG